MGKATGPPRGFDFDVTKTEQIFDLLLAEKHKEDPDEEGLRKEKVAPQARSDDDTSAGTNMVFIRPRGVVLHDYTVHPSMDNGKRANVLRSEIGLVLSADMNE
ncbi:hypothetical protein QYE76_060225 [Lolium multiflorum]|uniref:Uncharacterized protein n=1 Tax=Lolium multiflorum TaxID=4521 RepID=A0AAD8S0U4_LOLMU|nr:hypothetical protein QYE76_060225 [Lolium multiflorum]